MPFEAHGAVEGKSTEQPVLEGGKIPEVQKPAEPAAQAPAPETPAPKPVQKVGEPKPKAPEAAPTPGAADPAAPSPFTPNYKFKVMDKEHEIDEFVRAAIKDADTEKKIKEIYEKAYGLDVLKPRYQTTKEELKTTKEAVANYERSVSELREHYKRGDMDSFFQVLNVPQEKILQWVLDKANYEQLPPDQRQIVDAKRAAEKQAWDLEKQNLSLKERQEEVELQARVQTLQIALEKPDVSGFAEAFNARQIKGADGKTVSFMEEVIATGERAYYASKGKIDLTPEQAIKEVMERWAPFVQPPKPAQPPIIPAQPGPGAQAAAAQPAPAAAPKAPTIPNVTGRQTAAVSKAKPKSIDDLKKLYREKAGTA